MERGGPSTERTPLVPPRAPAYVYESALSRRFKQRLHTFQCCLCVSLIAILGVALLISVSFTLDEENRAERTNETSQNTRSGNLTMHNPALMPLLQLAWPRPDSAPEDWVGSDSPDEMTLDAAVSTGSAALEARKELEQAGGGGALNPDSPAGRAQQASATAAVVQPLADTAYAVEHATLALSKRSSDSKHRRGVGRGPRVSAPAPWPQPPYCSQRPYSCPQHSYRTYNGTCNNLQHPLKRGVALTPLRRALPPDYADGVSSPRVSVDGTELPTAREVSLKVHRPTYSRDTSFTVMMAVWGQFLDHDITATAISKGANGSSISCCSATNTMLRPHPQCYPVRLAAGDPFYHRYNLTCMEFVRSAPAPTCFYGPREQLNQMTAFIDGSVIYGSTEELVSRLRAHSGGELVMLRVEGLELLPQSTDPDDGCNTELMNAKGKYCFMSGDARANENLHLTTMHLVWARQHNQIARHLQEVNAHWDDERLFQEARRVVGAQMQHITYTEFLPVVLGSDLMESLNMTVQNSSHVDSYQPDVDPSIANHFASSAFRFAHTLLPGLLHSTDADTGSEEYIHLHEMLFNPYSLYSSQGAEHSISSAINNRVNKVDAHVTDELSDHLFERKSNGSVPGPCGLDLVSLNIQRGRDHGLPAYPYWREHCGLSRPDNWLDLEQIIDSDSLKRIQSIYSSVYDIDLYTGALSEIPGSRLLGPTLTCLVADQFLRLKIGDRFWYESADTSVGFSIEQLTEIRKTTLAGVLCANAAGLRSAQARVMEAVSTDNPLRACADLPRLDYEPWRETASQAK